MIDPPYDPRPLFDHPYGALRVAGVTDDPPEPAAMARLLPEEHAFAAGLAPLRRGTWVAGRLALAAALAEVGAPRIPLLATPRGAPAVPPGFVGSVSHKRNVAIAVAAPDTGAGLGADIEELLPSKHDISRRILTPAELEALDALPPEERFRRVLVVFSIKESIYKAVDPFVRRYVGFKEAEVDPGPRAPGLHAAVARLSLERGDRSFEVEAIWIELAAHVITSARVRPTADAR
ncbi:MAG: 4'-phosphopantetheinyl transferase superfamily protein [Minicystis sp.]